MNVAPSNLKVKLLVAFAEKLRVTSLALPEADWNVTLLTADNPEMLFGIINCSLYVPLATLNVTFPLTPQLIKAESASPNRLKLVLPLPLGLMV